MGISVRFWNWLLKFRQYDFDDFCLIRDYYSSTSKATHQTWSTTHGLGCDHDHLGPYVFWKIWEFPEIIVMLHRPQLDRSISCFLHNQDIYYRLKVICEIRRDFFLIYLIFCATIDYNWNNNDTEDRIIF